MKISNLKSLFALAKSVKNHSNYRIKMGAVLSKRGKPISVGFNIDRTHPKNYIGVTTIHAEQRAIMTCETNIEGSIMIVYREHNKTKMPLMAKPCECCENLMKENGVKGVFYSIDKFPFWQYEKYS